MYDNATVLFSIQDHLHTMHFKIRICTPQNRRTPYFSLDFILFFFHILANCKELHSPDGGNLGHLEHDL